jgi:hypothetical protein
MKTIRLMAMLSVVLTMGLVAMDTAHASPIVDSKGGELARRGDGIAVVVHDRAPAALRLRQ